MREEILVAPVAKYLSRRGRCVIKGRYCDASANVGIRGCYPLSLINDDVLATQLQLPLCHLALSVFYPFGVLRPPRATLPLSFSLSLSRALRVCSHARKIELCGSWRPASHHIRSTPTLFHPRFAPPSSSLPSRPLVRPSPSPGHGIYSSRTSRTTYNARYTPNSIPRNLRPLFRSHR